ncbi:hypothetical protein Tco_0784171 [Tanacetum coccineum]
MLITLLLFHKFWALMLIDVEELADGVKVTEGEKLDVDHELQILSVVLIVIDSYIDANNLYKQAMNHMTVAVALGEGGGRDEILRRASRARQMLNLVAALQEKLHFHKDQLWKDKAKVQEMGADLKVRFELLELSMDEVNIDGDMHDLVNPYHASRGVEPGQVLQPTIGT